MRILVCVKQVPDTMEVKLSSNLTLQRDFVAQVMNPADESALELALRLREGLTAERWRRRFGEPSLPEAWLRRARKFVAPGWVECGPGFLRPARQTAKLKIQSEKTRGNKRKQAHLQAKREYIKILAQKR